MSYSSVFRELHNGPGPLRLPNVWDAGSARIFEDLGAKAIATTSAGVAWALGYPDGNALPIGLLAGLTRNITRVIHIPLSVDVEEGYSEDPNTVAKNVLAIAEAGAVGINIEDGLGDPDVLVTKIKEIKEEMTKAGIDLFINARTDVYLQGLAAVEKSMDETVRRALLYKKAGADGIFIPGLTDPHVVHTIVKEVSMPVNLMAWPGLLPAAELGKIGVKRLSAGSGISQVLWQHAAQLAGDFLATGDSTPMSEGFMPYAKLQTLFAEKK